MGKGRKRKGPKASASAGVTPEPPDGGREATPVVPPRADTHAAPESTSGAGKEPDRRPDPQTGGSDRRIFRRVPFFRKVQYRFETLEEFKSRFASDISLGGMFIRTDEPEPLGTVVFLEFDLQDGSKILTGYGKVVRVNPRGVADFDPGMGIEFMKFDDESLRRIKQLIADRHPGVR